MSSQAQLANLPPVTAHDWLAPGVATALQEAARSQVALDGAVRSQAVLPGSTVPATPPASIQPPVPIQPPAQLRPGEPPRRPARRPAPAPAPSCGLSRARSPCSAPPPPPDRRHLRGLRRRPVAAGEPPSQHKPATDANAPIHAKSDSGSPQPPAFNHPEPVDSRSSPAACLIGRWIGTSENITGTINNNSVIYTGPGPIETYGADGTATTTYHDSKYSTTVNGVRWTQVVNGRATFHYEIQNGLMLFSDIRPTAPGRCWRTARTTTAGRLPSWRRPERFSCSGNTLREYLSNGSVVSTRAPAHQWPVNRQLIHWLKCQQAKLS